MPSTASLRAPAGFHIPKAISAVALERPSLFHKFGGHPCAAGFTCDAASLATIRTELTKEFGQQGQNLQSDLVDYSGGLTVPKEMEFYKYRPDCIWIENKQITTELLAEIVRTDPFGQDLPLPNLVFQININSSQEFKWLGSDQKHLKIWTENKIPVAVFNISDEIRALFLGFSLMGSVGKQNLALWVVSKPSSNAWNGVLTLELVADKVFIG